MDGWARLPMSLASRHAWLSTAASCFFPAAICTTQPVEQRCTTHEWHEWWQEWWQQMRSRPCAKGSQSAVAGRQVSSTQLYWLPMLHTSLPMTGGGPHIATHLTLTSSALWNLSWPITTHLHAASTSTSSHMAHHWVPGQRPAHNLRNNLPVPHTAHSSQSVRSSHPPDQRAGHTHVHQGPPVHLELAICTSKARFGVGQSHVACQSHLGS